jgi:hypothetical protein
MRRWRGVNPVVIDASAGVELAADTLRGRALPTLLPTDAVPWVPELFSWSAERCFADGT